MSEILRGLQGLSRHSADAIAQRLGMDPEARHLFVDRVVAAHARSAFERKAAEARLRRVDKQSERFKTLSLVRFKTIADWYHLAIVETLKLRDLVPSAQGLAHRLGLTLDQVRAALQRLETLGLVRQRSDDRYAPVKDSVISGSVPSEAVRSFHAQILAKAQDALVLQPMEQRDYTTSLMAIDTSRLGEIKRRIDDFVESLNAEFGASEKDQANATYAFATQLFRIDIERPRPQTLTEEDEPC